MAREKTATVDFRKNAEAEKVSASLPELDLEAQKLAGMIQGLRKRNIVGRSPEYLGFNQFRNGYDEPSSIDWRSSAKRADRDGNDMLMVRQNEREVTQMVYLWRDGSKSMDIKAPKNLYPNQPRFTKKQAAEVLLLAIAHLTRRAGERFTLLGSDLGMSGNRHGVDRILQQLSLDNAAGEDLPKLPMHRGKALSRNSHVFIVSDFLNPIEEIKAMVNTMATAGVKVHLIQVLDRSEIDFRFDKHTTFRDPESAFSHTIKDPRKAKASVQQIVQDHIRAVEDMARRVPGWSFHTYVTDQPLADALLPLYGLKPRGAASPSPKL